MPINLRLLVISLLVTGALCAKQTPALALEIGDQLPSMTMEDISGDSYDPSNQPGSVVLLYFLGSGCGICVDIASQVGSDFASEYGSDELLVLAIDSLDGSKEELTRLQDGASVRYPFLQNGSAFTTACDLEWHAFVIVDAEGTVRYVREGADVSSYDPDAMDDVISRYVGNAADAIEKTWGEIKQLFDR